MANKRVSLKGRGADIFFGDDAPGAQPPPAEAPPVADRPPPDLAPETPPALSAEAAPADALARKPASVLAPIMSDTEARDGDELIEAIRKTVKAPGKEVSFVRLTPVEKGRLADIAYTYKRRGLRTSENEINRIAVNVMLKDYEAHGEASILARVLEALYR